jgi:molybdopterin-containing oxidoreductase family iron-sulfur binding subunit
MNPPCTKVCPVTATYKNEQGVTVIDYDRCIGCRYCIVACPYGARTFDFGDFYTGGTPESLGKIVGQKTAVSGYEANPSAEYGKKWDKRGHSSPVGNARKCHFCLHRLAVGMLPNCTTTCVGRATFFGDRNDSDALVSELIVSPRAYRLKQELGTQPSVYYLR